ncbi:hypothetical protein [Chitinophaga barathri]|uniref:DUF2384 domain-containing protein n=1 Tax=Chitinophaga barathri TaxID=1647451 RepID=A0A3N4MYN6_9BACT|nr:hypothetical protein [Chitinophaga barathri]RPD40533.1 hypothetical protein EG028_14605 [Chitinophaga barathri]
MQQYKEEKDYSFNTVEAILRFQRLNFLQKIAVIRKGVTKEQLKQFKTAAGLDYPTIARLMSITPRYLHMKKSNDRFRQAMSDSIISIIDLYGFGYDHFNDPPFFNKWIKIGSPEKKYIPPIDYCDTMVGREEVKREIINIAYEKLSLPK